MNYEKNNLSTSLYHMHFLYFFPVYYLVLLLHSVSKVVCHLVQHLRILFTGSHVFSHLLYHLYIFPRFLLSQVNNDGPLMSFAALMEEDPFEEPPNSNVHARGFLPPFRREKFPQNTIQTTPGSHLPFQVPEQ